MSSSNKSRHEALRVGLNATRATASVVLVVLLSYAAPGPAQTQSATSSLDQIKTWGILVTNGQSFQRSFGWGQNHQYAASVEF